MKPTASTTTRSLTVKAKSKAIEQRPAFKDLPALIAVSIGENCIWFDLTDGRRISIPLSWSERLQRATPAQRQNFTVSAWNVFWDDIDEIIGVENVLYGNKLYLSAL